jgi:hypothetical protein
LQSSSGTIRGDYERRYKEDQSAEIAAFKTKQDSEETLLQGQKSRCSIIIEPHSPLIPMPHFHLLTFVLSSMLNLLSIQILFR